MIESLLIILWSIVVGWGQGSSVVWAGVVAIVPRISAAIDRTRTERDQLTAERDAFKQFVKRVAALDPDAPTARTECGSRWPATDAGVTTVVDPIEGTHRSTGDADPPAVSEVREAYRETVMAVSHYEDEYGESIDENLAAELGPDLARALSEAEVLTPSLQSAILSHARQASQQRTNLLAHVETEYTALLEARRRLRDIHDAASTIEDELHPRPVRELVQSWERLEALAADCEMVLRERQSHLQAEHERATMSMWSFHEYVYDSFEWRHPVLNDGLETLTRIRQAKQATVKAIYNW